MSVFDNLNARNITDPNEAGVFHGLLTRKPEAMKQEFPEEPASSRQVQQLRQPGAGILSQGGSFLDTRRRLFVGEDLQFGPTAAKDRVNELLGVLMKGGATMPSDTKPLEQPKPKFGGKGLVGMEPDYTSRSYEVAVTNRKREALKELDRLGIPRGAVVNELAYRESLLPRSQMFQTIGATAGTITAEMIGKLPGLNFLPEEMFTRPALAKAGARLAVRLAMTGLGGAGGAALDLIADPDEEFNSRAIAEAAGYEAATEGIFFAGEKLLGKIFGRQARLAADEVDNIQKVLDTNANMAKIIKSGFPFPGGTGLLPSQTGAGVGGQFLEEIADSSLGKAFTSTRRSAQTKALAYGVETMPERMSQGAVKGRSFIGKQAAKMAEDDLVTKQTINRFAKGLESAPLDTQRRMLSAAVNDEVDAARHIGGAYYRKIDSIIKEVTGGAEFPPGMGPIGLTGSMEQARKYLKEPVGLVDEAARLKLESLLESGPRSSLELADNFRSDFLEAARKAGKGKPGDNPSIRRIANGMAEAIRKDIDTGVKDIAKQFPDKAADLEYLLAHGRKMTARNAKLVNREIINQFRFKVAKNTKLALNIVENAELQDVKALMRVLPKDGQEYLRRSTLQGLFEDTSITTATKKTGKGLPEGEKFLERWLKIAGEDGTKAKAMGWSSAQIKDINDFGRTLALQAQTPAGPGRGWLFGAQMVAGITLAAGGAGVFQEQGLDDEAVAGAGLVLIGPAVLGYLLTHNRKFAQMAAQGFEVNPSTRQGLNLLIRLQRDVLKARVAINKERYKLEQEEKNQENTRVRDTRNIILYGK